MCLISKLISDVLLFTNQSVATFFFLALFGLLPDLGRLEPADA